VESLGGLLDEGWDAVVMPRVLKTDVGHRAHDIDYFAPDGAKYRSKVLCPSSRLGKAHAARKLRVGATQYGVPYTKLCTKIAAIIANVEGCSASVICITALPVNV